MCVREKGRMKRHKGKGNSKIIFFFAEIKFLYASNFYYIHSFLYMVLFLLFALNSLRFRFIIFKIKSDSFIKFSLYYVNVLL